MKRASESDRRGFTMVELLVVAVLGGFILAALYEVLTVNQRTYTAQSASTRMQQTLRTGGSVLYGELREISPAEGDIVEMEPNRLRVRAVRSFGHICDTPATATTTPTFLVRRSGQAFADGDSVTVFTENDPDRTSDDVWQFGRIRSFDIGGFTCPGSTEEAQEMVVEGVAYGAPPDSVLNGGPVRAFVHYEYRLAALDGETYLFRSGPDRDEPLVGPVDPEDGVSFEYLAVDGSSAANPTQVNEILITIRTTSGATDSRGEPLADSLNMRVFPRN